MTNSLDDRLMSIRNKIAGKYVNEPLPPRSEDLSGRAEYVLNSEVLKRMELTERGLRLPKNWEFVVRAHINAAIKPAVLPWCQRWEKRIKDRIRRLGEWLFDIAS